MGKNSSGFNFDLLKALAPLPTDQAESKANYSPQNVAPMIEGFAQILGVDKSEVMFLYGDEQNSKAVTHPGDKDYLPGYDPDEKGDPSVSMSRYEFFAKRSARLKKFMEESPAEIEYFN